MSDSTGLPYRKSTCLKCFDYSKVSRYFITICTNKREELFWLDKGNLNDAGVMAREWLLKLDQVFNCWIDCWMACCIYPLTVFNTLLYNDCAIKINGVGYD